eukprot:365163-Chlamydomonas_euryale.AAC.5
MSAHVRRCARSQNLNVLRAADLTLNPSLGCLWGEVASVVRLPMSGVPVACVDEWMCYATLQEKGTIGELLYCCV